jgi:hypothetical protein
MFRFVVALAALLIPFATLAPTPAQETPPGPAAAQRAPDQQKFSGDRLDQMVAPIALYPDALLSQVLMAATYPLEVVEAARFMQAHAGLVGSNLEAALQEKDWDASVKSLCGFPDLLQRMNDNLDWLRDLGDASLAQQDELMDAAQRMRARAFDSGNLRSTRELVVTQRDDRIIEIAPAVSEVVYVPTYYPTRVYGAWSSPFWWYPAFFLPPPPIGPWFYFGFGVPWGFGLWGGCDWGWGHSHVFVDVHAHNQFVRRTYVDQRQFIAAGPAARTPWQYDPSHRHGVNYRNAAVAQKYRGATTPSARIDPNVARGRIPAPRVAPAPRPQGRAPAPSHPKSAPAPRSTPHVTVPHGTAPHVTAPHGGTPQRVFTGARQPALDRAASVRGNRSRQGSVARPHGAKSTPAGKHQ